MARTTLAHPFDTMSGKLASKEKIVMRTRNGRTHAYAIKHPYKGPVAPERQRTITAFKDAVNQTTVILNTPDLRVLSGKRNTQTTARKPTAIPIRIPIPTPPSAASSSAP